MKFVLLTNSISAHQIPLAREIVKRLGVNNFRYVYTGDNLQHGRQEIDICESWITRDQSFCEDCETLLLGGLRPIELLERRSIKGLKTLYQSERWFKPFHNFPGWLRMYVPSYRCMAKRFIQLAINDPNFMILAIGPWAKKDFIQIGFPTNKIYDWLYFVEPSIFPVKYPPHKTEKLKVLWCGRMLKWKRVDTIIQAMNSEMELTLVGDGPEKPKLQKMSRKKNVTFVDSVPISEIRKIMHDHDVYVLSSNEQEGWGAALNEALMEGLKCFGTYEAGASAALLSEEFLFHSGDYSTLSQLLIDFKKCRYNPDIKDYHKLLPANGAEKLLAI